MNITDLGRVLNAMLQDVENHVGASYMEPQKILASALRSGAAKCAEIAKEQLDDDGPISPECVDTDAMAIEPGWITWLDNENIPSTISKIEVMFRGGRKSTGHASKWSWKHIGSSGDIIAYRHIDSPEQIT